MSSIVVAGDTSGTITISAPLVAGSGVLTLPTGTDTLVGKATTDTLTNKTLTSPTFDSASLVTISGTAPLYMCRAWVNFNGTGTVAIRASGNVSSITDNGVGNYTGNFTTAMPDANYASVGNSGPNATTNSADTVCSANTTSSFDVRHFESNAATDVSILNASIFR